MASVIPNTNDTLTEKRYLEYGDFKVSRNLANLLGFKGPGLMEFQKVFGIVRIEVEITRKKDQQPTFQVKGLDLGKRHFNLIEQT